MIYVIRFVAMSGQSTVTGPRMKEGVYLQHYDPEAYNGRGWADWTSDPKKAMTFLDKSAAYELWTCVPKSNPTRPDGKPNKPLTAFSISIEPLEEEQLGA